MSRIVTVSQSKSEKRSGKKRERRDLEGSIENGVLLAGCDDAEGEKSGCQDFLPFLQSLALHLTFSLFLSLFLPIFLDFCSKRRVAEMSLWAGLHGPTLKAALAKKRGGQEEGRSAKDRRVRGGGGCPPFHRH